MNSSETSACVFCNIVSGRIPAVFLLKDDDIVAFKDVHPVAPIHALVIPRRHVAGVGEVALDDTMLLGRIIAGARTVAAELGLSEAGYRLVINEGAGAGQSVLHLHCHVIGGRPLSWPPG
jgi:histidine triad (HIT) family protein